MDANYLDIKIKNLINTLNRPYSLKDRDVYKYLLAQLEIYLGEYCLKTNKQHIIESFLPTFYEKLWSMYGKR